MVHVRQASLADISAIMNVEEDWPEYQRASRDKMLTRLRKFPEGFWIFTEDELIIGTLSSCLIRYERDALAKFASWDAVTNHGYYPDIDRTTANALYLVSGVLRQDARGGKTYSLLIDTPVALAERLGLDYIVAGAKLPGYDAYCRRHGEVDAGDYAFMTVQGRLIDPFLEMYRGHGYAVPDRAHVVKDFYPDSPSRNYGAIVVKQLGK
jgi:hypothetical protein